MHRRLLLFFRKPTFLKNFSCATSAKMKKCFLSAEFAAFEWSVDETKLLYVAERRPQKSEEFYKRKPARDSIVEESNQLNRKVINALLGINALPTVTNCRAKNIFSNRIGVINLKTEYTPCLWNIT